MGPDKIAPRVLTTCAQQLVRIFCIIFIISPQSVICRTVVHHKAQLWRPVYFHCIQLTVKYADEQIWFVKWFDTEDKQIWFVKWFDTDDEQIWFVKWFDTDNEQIWFVKWFDTDDEQIWFVKWFDTTMNRSGL